MAKPERDAEALRDRLAGYSYEQIAKRMGYQNRSSAFKAAERAREAGAERDGIDLEILRLDAMQIALFRDALSGDVPAALAVVKIIDQRSKLSGHYRAVEAAAAAAPAAAAAVEVNPVDDLTARIAARRAAAGS